MKEMKSVTTVVIAVVIIVAVIAVVGVWYVTRPEEAIEKELWIGIEYSQPVHYCTQHYQANLMVIGEINEAGGLKVGDETYLIRTKVYNDRMIPEEALKNAKRLVEVDNCRIILQNCTSTCTLTFMPYLEERGDILLMAPCAGAGEVTATPGWGGTFAWRTRPTAPQVGMSAVKYAIEEKGWKRVAIMESIGSYEKSKVEGEKEAIEKLGGELVAEEWYEVGEVVFTGALASIKEAEPDVMFLGNWAGQCMDVIKQAYEMGFDEAGIQIFLVSGEITDEFMREQLGEEKMEGIYNLRHAPILYLEEQEIPEFMEMEERLLERFGEVGLAEGHVNGYDGLMTLFAAIEKAGTVTDIEKINDALRSLTPEDVSTLATFGAYPDGKLFDEHGQAAGPMEVLLVHDGQYTAVKLIAPVF